MSNRGHSVRPLECRLFSEVLTIHPKPLNIQQYFIVDHSPCKVRVQGANSSSFFVSGIYQSLEVYSDFSENLFCSLFSVLSQYYYKTKDDRLLHKSYLKHKIRAACKKNPVKTSTKCHMKLEPSPQIDFPHASNCCAAAPRSYRNIPMVSAKRNVWAFMLRSARVQNFWEWSQLDDHTLIYLLCYSRRQSFAIFDPGNSANFSA